MMLQTVGQMLATQARLQPKRLGARDLERSMSFAEWNDRACRLANALLSLGLTKGDRVAVLAFNRVEWAEIYAAVAKAGLVAVPINFRLTAPEARFICENCAISTLIAEEALASVADLLRDVLDVPNFIRIGCEAQGWQGYEALIADASDTEPDSDVSSDDTWCLTYTSDTTGNPKGAIRSHRGMPMLGLMTEIELGLSRKDDALLVMPMCHANSLNFFTAFLCIGAAATVFSRANFDAELCLKAFGEMGVTFSSLVQTHYPMMLDVPGAKRGAADFGRVEKLMVSSAPARVETKRAIMEMFPNSGLFELHGSTEAGWVTFLHPHEQFDHLGTVGREVVGSAPIRLLDENGEEVADGEIGEFYSSSPYAFEGYCNLPEKTAEACRGPYLSVGDMALRDTKGFIRLIDRKKNMIISGGENVYPTEVEAVLGQHPDIMDVAVVGLPDEKWGERVATAVVRRDGSALTAQTRIDWIRERLAGFKRARRVIFVQAAQLISSETGRSGRDAPRKRAIET